MVEKLAKYFGSEIAEVDGTTYYSFPSVNALSGDEVEEVLKKNGFGYRAKYISKSAKYIMSEGGEKWLNNLKEMEFESAKNTLMNLTGVGRKVIVALFSAQINY